MPRAWTLGAQAKRFAMTAAAVVMLACSGAMCPRGVRQRAVRWPGTGAGRRRRRGRGQRQQAQQHAARQRPARCATRACAVRTAARMRGRAPAGRGARHEATGVATVLARVAARWSGFAKMAVVDGRC
ncbi:hypothetical protein WI77_10255 [Burkholderia ubonensis]|nr:hypothetical protein WI77_10255 [Burkholderia ubonensis]